MIGRCQRVCRLSRSTFVNRAVVAQPFVLRATLVGTANDHHDTIISNEDLHYAYCFMTLPPDLAKRILRDEWERLSLEERRVIEHVLERIANRGTVSRDTNAEFHEARTFGERLADGIAVFGGSWTFILLFLAFLLCWALINTEILGPRHIAVDPYPYIFLNLMLSMLAALQAPVIMMSQNRQGQRDRLAAQHDYEVNLKAELEIRTLHEKLDALRESQWAELVAFQRDQIRLLEQVVTTLCPPATPPLDSENQG